MSIEAEIEETVSAFVAGLMDLVRETALETVRKALGNNPAAPVATPPRSRAPASLAKPASPAKRVSPASLRPRSVGPATVRSSQLTFLDQEGVGRAKGRPLPGAPLGTRAKPAASVRAAAPPPPPVVVRRIPPRRRREARAVPPPPPPLDLGPIEPVPAKNWVVVRRPARERREGEVNASGGGHDGGDPHAPGAGGHDGGDPHTPGAGGHDGGDARTPGAAARVEPAAPAKPRSLRKPAVAAPSAPSTNSSISEGPASVPPVTAVSSSGKLAAKPRSLRKPPVAEPGPSAAKAVELPPAQGPRSVRKPRVEETDAPSPSVKPRSVRKPEAPTHAGKSRDVP